MNTKLTEELNAQLKIKYQNKKFDYMFDEETLREDIRALEHRTNLTDDEKNQLELLQAFRHKNCSYPSLAYYDVFELAQLFD